MAANAAANAAHFPAGTLVFVPDAQLCFAAAHVVKAFRQGEEGGQVELLRNEEDEEDSSSAPPPLVTLSAAQSSQCLPMDDQSLGSLANMVEFRVLNEASLLHNLRARFSQDEIYTNIGDVLVSVNPFKQMEDLYTPDTLLTYIKGGSSASSSSGGGGEEGDDDVGAPPPHVFRVADLAVRRMLAERAPQSCIVSGESGAGKTEATKVFLQYLAEVSSRNSAASADSGGGGGGVAAASSSSLQDRILQANPLLEAFGNAKTKRNDNSSRFGKYIQIAFNPAQGTVTGGGMTSYLLEKSRVVFVAEGERNYHVFYQLVAGAAVDKQLRTKYMLSHEAANYNYLNQSSCVSIESINDAREWQQTVRAMEMIGLTEQQRKDVFITLAGILHLGNVAFTAPTTTAVAASAITDKSSLDALSYASQCLGFSTDNLSQALIKRDVSVRGEKIFKDNTVQQAQIQRDALAKHLYSLLFDWLFACVNKSLGGGTGKADQQPLHISVLDIFGFESFDYNSYEQLLINHCNEKLLNHFNAVVFEQESALYLAEGLDVSDIAFKDNSDTVNLLEAKRGAGLLSLMDEEGNTPNATDLSLLKKILDLKSPLLAKPEIGLVRQNPKKYSSVFILTHFAGPVCYNVDGFLEKNKDSLAPELVSLVDNTQREFILDLVPVDEPTGAANAPQKKKISLGFKFKTQLGELMDTLQRTQPHFIRCIKSNALKRADDFSSALVLSQLRYSGLLEVCRIRQSGYPVQRTFADFAKRYALLASDDTSSTVEMPALLTVLTNAGVLPSGTSDWQVGRTKLFFRNPVLNRLERVRDDKLRQFAIRIQRTARGYVARRQHRRYQALLLQLKRAMHPPQPQSPQESTLEQAILASGSLPYRGVHLKLVQDAHTMLDRLRACSRCLRQLDSAVQAQDTNELTAVLRVAVDDLGLAQHASVQSAQQLTSFLLRAAELKLQLRQAIQSRELGLIQSLCATCKQHSRADVKPIDCSEAEMMVERLLYINTLGEEIAQLVQTKGDVKRVIQLVGTLRETGGSANHPSVLLGETYCNEQAIVSAAHAERVQATKTKILAAGDDLLALIMLEMEAIQLGVDKDADLARMWERKRELERQQALETKLATAAAQLSSSSEAVDASAIAAYDELVKQITWRDTKPDQSLADLARKQLVARKRLDALMGNGGKNADNIKQAVKEAQALGINSETARKAQAMLTLKSIAAEEKKEMRRRSMMPLPGGAMLQAEEPTATAAAPGTTTRKAARPSLRPAPHRASIKGGFNLASSNKKAGTTAKSDAEHARARCLFRLRTNQQHSALWAQQCMEFSNRAFKFENFAGFRSNEDYSALEPEVERKLYLAQTKLVHVKNAIPKSLLQDLGGEQEEEAVTCFKSVLGWSLDAPAQFPQTLGVYFLKQGMAHTGQPLADELYAQLIKQLRRNAAGKESIDRLWLLLCLACESFAPSREFLPCVVNFLMLQEPDCGDLMLNYAHWCLFQLCATVHGGDATATMTPVTPTVKYVSSFIARPPVLLKIHLVYRVTVEVMAVVQIPVWPDQDVGQVEHIICELEGFSKDLAKTSGLFLKDIDKPRAVRAPPPPPLSPSNNSKPSPNKLRVDPKALMMAAGSAAVPSPLAIKNRIMSFVRTKKPGEDGGDAMMDEQQRMSSAGSEAGPALFSPGRASSVGAALFSSGRASTVSTKSGAAADGGGGGGGKFFQRASMLRSAGAKSFRIQKSSSSSLSTTGEEAEEGGGGGSGVGLVLSNPGDDALLNAYIAVSGGGNAVQSGSGGEDGGSGGASTSAAAAQLSRVPPPPFAPWPLPRSFFLGDVFLRLVAQDRLPYLTFQRKLFVFDTQPDQPTYVQILQDVLNNRLPLADFWQVLQLACVSVLRARMVRGEPGGVADVQSLVASGLYSYIPMTWLTSTSYDWAGVAMDYLSQQGSALVRMTEQELYAQYLGVCQTQPLFGASLFSVIHKDLASNLVACLNANGLHVLTNESSPAALALVGYKEMIRFGASSTLVWVELTADAAQRLPQLAVREEAPAVAEEEESTTAAAPRHLLHLHTQQAREIYQQLTDYSYWFHHGFVKA